MELAEGTSRATDAFFEARLFEVPSARTPRHMTIQRRIAQQRRLCRVHETTLGRPACAQAPTAARLMERMANSHVEKAQLLLDTGAQVDKVAVTAAKAYGVSSLRLFPSEQATAMLAEAEQHSCYWRMLSQLNELRATHFDSANAAHTKLLVELWKLLGSEPMPELSVVPATVLLADDRC